MPNYQNGKIYKLVNDELNLTYYGSTTIPLSQRLAKHKQDIKKPSCGTTSKKLFESGEVRIILVEKYSCQDKEELLKKEREYIENHDCVNKNIPTRTLKEYYEDNKDKIKEIGKKYYEANKDKITEWHKEYYENNKDKKKEYYKANKDKISEKRKQKKTCECGSVYRSVDKSKHERSKKHKTYETNKS